MIKFKGTNKVENASGNLLVCLYFLLVIAEMVIFPVKSITNNFFLSFIETPINICILVCTVYLPFWVKRTELMREVKSEKVRKVISFIRNSHIKFAVFACTELILLLLVQNGPLANIPVLHIVIYIMYDITLVWMALYIISLLLNEPTIGVEEKGENNVAELQRNES